MPVSVLSAMHVGVLFAARGVLLLLLFACTWLLASGCFLACLLTASVFRGSEHLTLHFVVVCMHALCCLPRHVLSFRLSRRVRLGLSYVIIFFFLVSCRYDC